MSDILSAWQRSRLPKDRRPIYEWAKDNVILSAPLTKTGPFDVSDSRHFIAPLDAYQDDYTREVNLLMAVRGGKTLIADILSMWIPVIQPGPLLWIFQDDKARNDQAELRTWKLIEKCKAVLELLSADRHASRTNEINFPHMPFHLKGPADSNLQSRGWQNVFLDEVHLYKKGKIEEARGRLGDFVKMGTDKLLCLSQGGEDGGDWSNQFNRGVIHTWHVECAKCGHFQYPAWSGTRADGSRWGIMFDSHKDQHGLWIPARVVPTVRFECARCAHPHTWNNRTKSEWNRTGKYIAESGEDKFKTKKSFTAPATIDYPWDQLCDLYLQAMNEVKMGNPLPLIQFFQKRMAQFSSEKTVMEGSLNLSRAVYEINSEWPAEDVRLMAVDVQGEHFWVQVRGFSFGREDTMPGESRRYYFGKLYSYTDIEALREKFKVPPCRLQIDSGYQRKKDVYAACFRYGWSAVKGVKKEQEFIHETEYGKVRRSYGVPLVVDTEIGTPGGGKRFIELQMFCAQTIEDRLDGLIEKGIWKEPQNVEDEALEEEYRRQMAANFKRKMVNSRTKAVTFVRVDGENNHAKDLGKILILGAILTDVMPDPYDERRKLTQAA